MNPMQEALDLTWSTLNARMRNYRIAAVLVLASATIVGIALVVFRSAWVLVVVPILPAVVLAFLGRDTALVHRWEEGVLDRWTSGDLPLEIFAQALSANPGPLRASLKSMIGSLPLESGNASPTPEESTRVKKRFGESRFRQESRMLRAWCLALSLSLVVAGILAYDGNPKSGIPFIAALAAIGALDRMFAAIRGRSRKRPRP